MQNLPVDAALVALVAILVQLIKPYLELWLKPDAPEHDPTIQAIAVVIAIGLHVLESGVPIDGPAVVTLLGYGLGTALAAIGGYHILTATPGGRQAVQTVYKFIPTPPAKQAPEPLIPLSKPTPTEPPAGA